MTTEEKLDRILDSVARMEANYAHCLPMCHAHNKILFTDSGIKDNGDTMGLISAVQQDHMHVRTVRKGVTKLLFAVVAAIIAAVGAIFRP